MKPLRRTLSIRVQLLALFGLLLLTGLTVLVLDEANLRHDIATLDAVRDQSLTGLRLVKSISDGYGIDVVDTTFRVRNQLMGWDQGIEVIDSAESSIKHDWKALVDSELPAEQRALTDELARLRVIADHASQKLRSILVEKDIAALGKFADTELYPAMDPVTSRLKFLSDLKMLEAERNLHSHIATARTIGFWRVLLSLFTLTIVLIVGRSILRKVYKGVESLVHIAQRARDRDFAAPPRYVPDGELGEVHEALLAMRRDLLNYENDLIASEQRAQAASRAKSSFLAAMSHEIRTPMVGVASMLELLAQTDLDAEQRAEVEIVQSSAQSLLQIIGDILDFSKIEAGKLELTPTPVDLRQLVRASVNNFRGTASTKGLRLECTIDERLAPAHLADALRLRQILSNLLSNALKFTERGEVLVQVERLAIEGQRELIALRVRDSGIGIEAKDHARLFQAFEQAGDGGTRNLDSTGLGLSICRRLAEIMGGEITLQSQIGSGSTFSLIVRLAQAEAALLARPPEPAALSRPAPSIEQAERARSLVLLVDDHPTNRAVIQRQLNQLGYACETAPDGEAGLKLWRSGRFGLLLTDLHMPRRDGYGLAAAIRADERLRGATPAPLIALSANVSTEEVERSRSIGLDDFLAKPTPLALLATTLQRYLPHAGALSSAAQPLQTVDPHQVTHGITLDHELLDDFVRSARLDIRALFDAIVSADATAIAHEAHRIKGASGLVGADAVAACAARIEAAARSQDLSRTRTDVAELERELQRFAADRRISDTA